ATLPVVPNSQINFILASPLSSGTTAYMFRLQNRAIEMWDYRPSISNPTFKTLAKNVTGLNFTGDYRDPSILYITLRIDAPTDASGRVDALGRAENASTVQVINAEVHMVVNP